MTDLPRYKSKEFNLSFKFEVKNRELIQKFKRDGELSSETEVKISKCYNYEYNKELLVDWERPTAQGKETIRLIDIEPTDGFLEFLDKFLEKKGIFSKYWVATYVTIMAACNLCQQDQERFKKLVRETANLDDLLIAAAFRD